MGGILILGGGVLTKKMSPTIILIGLFFFAISWLSSRVFRYGRINQGSGWQIYLLEYWKKFEVVERLKNLKNMKE